MKLKTNNTELLTKTELVTITGGGFWSDFNEGVNHLYDKLLEYIGASGV